MDRYLHVRNTLRHLQTVTIELLSYLPADDLVRLDKEQYMKAFSMVNNGERVGFDKWSMGQGWEGTDTEIGKKYDPDPQTLSPGQLAKQYNTDKDTDAPYGNEDRKAQWEKWTAANLEAGKTIPLVVATESRGELGQDGHRMGS